MTEFLASQYNLDLSSNSLSRNAQDIEMDDSTSRATSRQSLLEPLPEARPRPLAGVARHTLGLILLLCVVFLWTLCNFLGSVRVF